MTLLPQQHTYVSPYDLWSEMEQNQDTRPTWLLSICETVADLIDTYCRRHFVLETATKYFDRPADGSRLHFGFDLLSLTTLTVGRVSGVVWTEGTQFWLKPLNSTPKKWMDAEPGYTFRSAPETKKAISVAGVWGYIDREIKVTDVGSGDITDSATTLPVTAGEGTNMDGMLIEIGSELMYVSAAAANAVTVVRGVFGTTAAAHSENDDVNRKLPPAIVRRAALALAVRAYRQAQSGFTDIAGFQASGELVFAKDIPADVKLMLNSVRRTQFA